MFIVILGTVLGLMHCYIWKRLVKDTSRGRARWALTAVFVALLVLLVCTLLLPRLSGWREPAWLAWAGYIWFGLIVYLFLALLVTEPVRIALHRWVRQRPADVAEVDEQSMNRRAFIAKTSAVAAGVASVSLVGFGMASALGSPDVLAVPVRLRRLDPAFDGFRIAVVSDIHIG